MPTTRHRTEFDFGTILANLLAVTRHYFELPHNGTVPQHDPGAAASRSVPHLVEVDTEFADTVPIMMPTTPPPPG